jgi:hypothetical protein
LHNVVKSKACVYNILYDQQVPALYILIEIFQKPYPACFFPFAAVAPVTGDSNEINSEWYGNLARQIGEEEYRSFEDGEQEQFFPSVIMGYLLRQLLDLARDNLLVQLRFAYQRTVICRLRLEHPLRNLLIESPVQMNRLIKFRLLLQFPVRTSLPA